MAFQTPVTVAQMLQGIHERRYLLPAIQREFVWDTDQIRKLVDSLLLGYPIGSFLLWNVEAAKAKDYTFYNFLTDYHQRDNRTRRRRLSRQGNRRSRSWTASSVSRP